MSRRVLLQLDVDSQPSAFDSMVAVDAGVEQLLRYGSVKEDCVAALVHGAMFTRGGSDLKHTAIFVGGSNVSAAESILKKVRKTFFGPVRVSVMMDASGCNTTAAAAVVAASRHLPLAGSNAVVLGGTGPVGLRVGRMLARQGSHVILTSRSLGRAEDACRAIQTEVKDATLEAAAPIDRDHLQACLSDAAIIIACGAAGTEMLDAGMIPSLAKLVVAIDLNAVPPAGIGGLEPFDKAKTLSTKSSAIGYGPIGVGGLKMRTHKAAIGMLFQANDRVLDADEIFDICLAQENQTQNLG